MVISVHQPEPHEESGRVLALADGLFGDLPGVLE